MNRKTIKAFVIALLVSVTITPPSHAASIGAATVNVQDLNFRQNPSLDSEVYTTVAQDTLVVVGEKVDDDWYKVVFKGAVGFMAAEYITFSESLNGDFGMGTINGAEVPIYCDPSYDSDIFAVYAHGTEMSILGVYGGWYKVGVDGFTGFVHSDSMALNGGVSEFFAEVIENNRLEAGQQIVDAAMQYMGVRYVWAGTSPSGFDCSGFVYYVYKECGYSINRTAASIYNNGVYVDKDDLEAGDAVCFSSSSQSIGHVGIYIGDGQFIHASSGSGKVIISEMDSSYYLRNYVGARRIV